MIFSESCTRREVLKSSVAVATGLATHCHLSGQETTEANPFSDIETVLKRAVEDKAFPGCSACCGSSDHILWQSAFGHLSLQQQHPVKLNTLYDLASLTKIVGTTSVAARLIKENKLSLNEPILKWVPEFSSDQLKTPLRESRPEITIRYLLTHTSGLPAWKPIYKSVDSYHATISRICETALEQTPGAKYRYSDLGMMLLGEILGRAGGAALPQLERDLIFKPLKMSQTVRNPQPEKRPLIAPTERIGDSDRFWQGVVHDENARGGEGITGHAGLFSNVNDLAKFAQAWLNAVQDKESLFSSEIAKTFASRQKLPGDARRGLGWQMFSKGGSGGSLLSESAFGHTGFTGTSLWIDPEKNLFFILLSNRVHPTRQNSRHLAVRRDFADAVIRAVEQN